MLILIIALLLIIMFCKIIFYKKSLDRSNIQLIQFYLDMKFLYQGLNLCLNTAQSSVFCKELIREIKEYYNLEDIIIIDSLSMVSNENNTKIRSMVISFIQNNIIQIKESLHDHKITKIMTSNIDTEYVLYLSRLMEKDVGDALIVCVEKSPSLLVENELLSLENCIKLLKIRLIYE